MDVWSETRSGRVNARKFRSVWISFAGRIAAQLIGAIATVTLGVLVLGKGHSPSPTAEQAAAVKPTVLIATPVRTHGETVIVMLPSAKTVKSTTRWPRDVAEVFEKTKTDLCGTQSARRQTPTDRPALQSADLSADTPCDP